MIPFQLFFNLPHHSLLCNDILNPMRRLGKKWGVVSMCIGGGMGAAGLFEMLD
jgi:acetyl-CoA acyltransferase